MSFILDALKKSENERQQQGDAEFATVPTSADGPRAPRWIWVLLALLVINVTVLFGLLLRHDTRPIIATTPEPVRDVPVSADTPSFAEQVEVARRQQNSVARSAPESSAVAGNSGSPVSQREAEPAGAPQYSYSALPTLNDLRADGTLQLPELHLDIHVYSDTPSERFVFINMVRHREASRLAEGPVVSEITPEGVVLNYSGTRFLLPRE